MTIYVIVKVTYDWYRFQDNLGATTYQAKAREMAKRASEEHNMPMFESDNAPSDNQEIQHIWIEEFPQS